MKRHMCAAAALVICATFSSCRKWSEEERITDISQYSEYFGADGIHKKNAMIRSDIFPEELPPSANAEEFSYHYYNAWDPNFTNILIYSCNEEDHQAERARLESISSSTELLYGVTGFPYELCAVNSDEYGIIYAMDDAERSRFIYAEITFCNYFSDMDYKSEIGSEFLPINFDASKNNPERKKFEKDN